MKVKWLVQDVGISMANIEANFETLKRLGIPYDNFGLIPFTKTISNLENILQDPDEQFIIRGGTKILTLLQNISQLSEVNEFLTEEQLANSQKYIQNIMDGVFYNEKNFDQAYYGKLDLPLLNRDAALYPIKDNLNLSFSTDMFLKPSKDQKAFNAGILEKGYTISDFINNQTHQKGYIDEIAVVAPCKKIYAEYRFFVVEEQVITGSKYRIGQQVHWDEVVPESIHDAAKEYAKLYQPHDVFTMDLADTPDGISIVEYNCWNASGLYKTNVEKIFNVVNEYKIGRFSHKPKIR